MTIKNLIELLLIEDSNFDAYYLMELLSEVEMYQFNIHHYQSLGEGLNNLNDTIDVVLLDLILPDSQGEETILNMTPYTTTTPFILLTGLNDTQLALKAIEQGAQDYICKDDLNQELLVRVIQYAMERKKRKLELHRAYESVEKQVQVKTKELEKARDELRELAKRLINIQEEQQGRISRQVHDVLGQALTGLKIDIEWIQNELGSQSIPYQQAFERTYKKLDDLVLSVRQISSELRPGILDDLGLLSALEWQVNEFTSKTGIQCELILNPEDFEVENELATTLFRITQEALTNIIRHANATQVHIFLQLDKEKINLIIDDNGKGFSPELLKSPHALGLIGMRERVLPWNGMIDINSKAERGTEIFVEIPLTN